MLNPCLHIFGCEPSTSRACRQGLHKKEAQSVYKVPCLQGATSSCRQDCRQPKSLKNINQIPLVYYLSFKPKKRKERIKRGRVGQFPAFLKSFAPLVDSRQTPKIGDEHGEI